MNRLPILKCLACVALPLALISRLSAQAAPPPDATDNVSSSDSDEVVELSPFVVDGSDDKGYAATATLAANRIRTDIKDVGSSISVITQQFLEDTNSMNATQLLVYTPNTEVSGQGGNFLGVGDQPYAGSVRYGSSRVRGLSNADNTRDFFLTDIPWDGYNTGRIDIQRGPNSILFGIGSPAGIVNASLNHANYKDSNKVENQLDNFGRVRFSGDFNKVLIDKQLAVRLSLLDDNTKFKQEPAYRHDKRIYGALRYDPAFLNTDKMRTTFEASYEKGDIDSNLPRNAPPNDYLTPWFSTLTHFQASGVPMRTGSVLENDLANYRLWQSSDQVTQGGAILAYTQGVSQNFNYRENSADGPYHGTGFLVGIGGLGRYVNERGIFPGASVGAWKNQVITDRSIFDSYNVLLDGPTKGEFNDFDALRLEFRQSFFDDTLGYELSYDKQKTHQGSHNYLSDAGYGISVDVMGTELGGVVGGTDNPAGGVFPETPDPVNPNLGRAFVVGGRGAGHRWNDTEKEALRFTGFYDLDFKKLMGEQSKIGKIFGDNRFTILASSYKADASSASGSDFYTDSDYVKIANDSHVTYFFDYLTNQKLTGNDPSNLHLPGLTGYPVIESSYMINQWDSTNKVWVPTPFNIVTNYDKPETDRIYNSASKNRRTVETFAAVWQGYWFDGTIIPMAAWRRDKSFFNQGGYYEGGSFVEGAPFQSVTLASNSTDRYYFPYSSQYVLGPDGPTSTVDSKTYSIVTHLPKKLRAKLPGNMDVQLFYNQSENFQPQPGRVDIQNRPIADPSGRTKEYGFSISALNDKVYLKVAHYETHEENADLGNLVNLSGFAAVEVWARSAASVHAGKQGAIGSGTGNWQADTTYGVSSDGHIVTFKPYGPWARDLNTGNIDTWQGKLPNEPFPVGTVRQSYTQAEIDAQWASEKAAIDAILNNPPPDSFITAMGINRDAFFSATGPGMFDYGGGTASAVVTGSTVSKGTEFELVANPVRGLSISFNASKTEAKRTSIAQSYIDYLNERRPFFYGPAGDMRIWSSGWADLSLDPYTTAGNGSLSVAFQSQVDSPISLFLASEDTKVPELKPWAFNLVANYAFQSDSLRGINVGGGYRWQDRNVVGYPITHDEFGNETYDVDHPYYGYTEAAVDLWAGYERKFARKYKWRIKLNVRNVFANDHLIKTSANPDGSGAAYRIPEPRTFTLTNTLEF